MTTTDLQGALRAENGHASACFERVYDTDPADLWSAITDRARLARWFAPVEGHLVKGCDFLILFDADDPSQQTAGTVLECEAPERLVVLWRVAGEPDSSVTVLLAPSDGGTRLVLEHSSLPMSSAAGYGAGWHAYLEQLAASLDGKSGPGDSWDERWSELLPAYQAQLAR